MDNTPLISVIIPAYNSATTIGEALESIVHQTYQNLEIIVVDDKSTDSTREIVEVFCKKDSRISYFLIPFDDPQRFNVRGRNINAGYSARNYAFEKVHGDYITFQDADDASLLNRIEFQYSLLTRFNATHLCLDWQQLQPGLAETFFDGEKYLTDHPECVIRPEELTTLARATKGIIIPIIGTQLTSLIPFELKRKRVINKLFFRSLAPYPGTGNSPLFSREVISKVRFRKLSDRIWPSFMGRGADRDFNFQVAETFHNSYICKIPLYLWRTPSQNDPYSDIIKKYGYKRHSNPNR